MLMKKLIVPFVMILLLLDPALAEVSCRNCRIGGCTCTITDCDSGIIDFFNTSSCSLYPDYEFTFSSGHLDWSPEIARSYSVKALCSDGTTQSDCNTITVSSAETTTTTVKVTTTTQPTAPSEGPDYFLFVLIAILIVAILAAVYYLFFVKKKRKRKSFEELYRKWRR